MSEEPRDPAAERAVLAGVYRHGWDAWVEVDGLLAEETFTDPFHRVAWRCFGHMFDRRPDAKPDVALVEMAMASLKLDDVLEKPDNVKLLRGITTFYVERGSVRPLAERVRRLHVVRGMRSRLLDAAAAYERFTGEESLNEIVGRAEAAVFDYERELSGESDDAAPFGATAPETVLHWAEHPVEQVGFRSGFPEFDRAIGGGLRPGGVDVIGARSGAGKSMLCDTIARNLADDGVPCLVVDTETEIKDRLGRMIARMSGVRYQDVETGRYRSPEDRDRAGAAAAALKASPIDYKSVVGRQPDEILAVVRRWVVRKVGLDPLTRKARPCVVLFDYLKFTDQSQLKNVAEYQAIGFLMTKLHAFMSRYGVACAAFVQLNREGINAEDASAVSQGDRIVWLCTSFSIFKWKAQEDLDLEYAKPKGQPRYTHRLLAAIKSRYGGGLRPGDWLHVETDYARGVVREGPANSALEAGDPSRGGGRSDSSREAAGGLDFS